ncbi:MAG: UvrD-helicase domain-containing protein, partial [Planctomycetota bacterium]
LEEHGEGSVWDKLSDWSQEKWSKSLLKVVSEEEDLKAFAKWAKALRESLEVLKAFDHELFEASRRVLGVLLGDVQRGFRQRGILTFTDLLTHAEKLLRENAEVRVRVRNNLDQLLVDEFQDTDPLQCSIIRSLMQAEPGKEAQAPGLFLVGDPKQSIYGFRRADLGAYDAFKAEITQGSDHVYRLDVNHRSFPWILDEVERCIAPSMEREEGIQPEFQPLLPSPKREAAMEAERFPKEEGAPHGVEHWLIWSRVADENDLPLKLTSSEPSELEGQLVTADLLRLKASGEITNWAEVGLLFRTLGHVEPLLLALRDAGIPYDVSGDKSYYRRREIRDISSIVRAVLDPIIMNGSRRYIIMRALLKLTWGEMSWAVACA